MQAIGLCRFSYPALGGFQIRHKTTEDRIALLYASERMEERLRLFQSVALPCLVAQTDPRWDMIIVIGDSLPKHYCDRLHDLVARIPQISIQIHPPRPQREVMKEILNAARTDPTQPCLQFRFDDDDAVSVDFIARFRAAADDCAGLNAKHQVVAYDWHKGFAAQFGPAGIVAHELHYRQYVASLGVHVAGGSNATIMNFAHHRIDRFMPIVSFGDAPMWVESHNGFNDSPPRQKGKIPMVPLTPEQVVEFSARFAIDQDAVKAAFSS
ncbi:MAG: putative rhamnosyl transferase [Yoonia sp.]|nr:putative rhamnosyl transferase [Yoonia sp.]